MLFRDDMRAIAAKARSKVFAAGGDDVDAVLTTDPAHVGYLTGYRSILLDYDRNYRCAALLTRELAILVTGASDAAAAIEVLRDPACVYRYGTFFITARQQGTFMDGLAPSQPSFPEAVLAALRAVVKPGATVGLDLIDGPDGQSIRSAIDNRKVEVRPAIVRARSVKEPEEIEKIRHAAAISERGIDKAFADARPGMTEIELATVIAAEITADGGVPRFVVVTAGERSALVDAYATRQTIEGGDLIRVDVGCTYDGYWADLARTAVMGSPSRQQRERYAALLNGELAQLALARPGITAGDLFDVAMNEVRKGVLADYQRSHCGHGIGIGAHEFPTLNPAHRDVEIVAGMVLCVETPYYEIGWGGMMVEDIIAIGQGGNECLTRLPRELRCL